MKNSNTAATTKKIITRLMKKISARQRWICSIKFLFFFSSKNRFIFYLRSHQYFWPKREVWVECSFVWKAWEGGSQRLQISKTHIVPSKIRHRKESRGAFGTYPSENLRPTEPPFALGNQTHVYIPLRLQI